MTDLDDLLREFDCHPTWSGSGREQKKRAEKREKVEKTRKTYLAVMSRPNAPTSLTECQEAVQQGMTAGMGPLAAWFFWQLVGALINKVVSWLWERYNRA